MATRIQVQGSAAAGNASQAFTSNVQVGSLIVVFGSKISNSAGGFAAGDCTQTAGTAVLSAIAQNDAITGTIDFSNTASAAIWSAIVTTAGSLTLQVVNAGGLPRTAIHIAEYSGSWDSTRLEVSGVGQTSGTVQNPSTGNATSAGAALFAAITGLSGAPTETITEDAAFSLISEETVVNDGAIHSSAIDQIVATGTTDAAAWTATVNNGWAASLVVLKEAAGGVTLELSGSGSLNLTATGDLTGDAALSGSGALALAASGDLTGDAALSGSAALALAASGDLVGAAALSGSGALSLTASGDLVGDASLGGAAGLALAASGNLAIDNSVDLFGSAALALIASGNLTGDAALSGSAELVLTGSGKLLGGEPVGGHYWPTETRRDYRAELDERRLAEQRELRELIEKAAGLLETAEDIAEPEIAKTDPVRVIPVFRSQVADLRAELNGLRAHVETLRPEIDLGASRRRIDLIIAKSTDDLISRIADVLTDLVSEIIEDDVGAIVKEVLAA